MLFNSIDFAVFLPLVFILYWFVFKRSIRWQNALVVFASYIFYGWWDWRFLTLILFSTLVDYGIGIALSKKESKRIRKLLVIVSLTVNLGLLGFFKYYNFFIENFVSAFTFFGEQIQASSLSIILPVGISFYTFQTLSYTLDVYKKKLEPTTDFVAFAAFVSFFPQLVAGPIERAKKLLPQFYKERTFNYEKASDGARQILWGFFKKIVIADNCAEYANLIFNNSDDYSGSTLVIGAFFFAFQIYGDFSGYSDIAIGTARLFGFDLMKNFAFPYFSRDIAEFWRRWHISLSTWFRDYLYIPLGGSRGGTFSKIRNTFIIFVVSGFWHGANWTFIAWGFLNALYFLPLQLSKKNRVHLDTVALNGIFPSVKEAFQIMITFGLTVLAWIFFRAENMGQAFGIFSEIFSTSLLTVPELLPVQLFVLIFLFVSLEWIRREKNHALESFSFNRKFLNYLAFIFLIVLIYLFGNFDSSYEFIYFQF